MSQDEFDQSSSQLQSCCKMMVQVCIPIHHRSGRMHELPQQLPSFHVTNAIVPSDPRQFRLYELQEALIFLARAEWSKQLGFAGHLAAELTPAACINGHANSI